MLEKLGKALDKWRKQRSTYADVLIQVLHVLFVRRALLAVFASLLEFQSKCFAARRCLVSVLRCQPRVIPRPSSFLNHQQLLNDPVAVKEIQLKTSWRSSSFHVPTVEAAAISGEHPSKSLLTILGGATAASPNLPEVGLLELSA